MRQNLDEPSFEGFPCKVPKPCSSQPQLKARCPGHLTQVVSDLGVMWTLPHAAHRGCWNSNLASHAPSMPPTVSHK